VVILVLLTYKAVRFGNEDLRKERLTFDMSDRHRLAGGCPSPLRSASINSHCALRGQPFKRSATASASFGVSYR
jgi:hypothetical protein